MKTIYEQLKTEAPSINGDGKLDTATNEHLETALDDSLETRIREWTIPATRATRAWVTPLWMLLVRVAMGILMLTLGIRLLTEGGWNAWMQIGGFLPSIVRGPFAGPFVALWESPIILNLVIWGSILVGTAMILGLFVRLAAIGGALMMLGFYLATLPPQFGWVNQQMVFLLIFSLFPALGPGYQLGLDHFLKPLERRYLVLRFVLG